MKGCRGLIFSTVIFNISYSFAAIALQLLLFSNINQAFCGKPATSILLPSAELIIGRDGDGTRCIRSMRNTLPPKHYFDEQSLNEALRNLEESGPKEQRLRLVKSHGRGLVSGAIGSTPPKCVSKCSKCTPCTAVRVPIQPGRTKVSLMEYYPEAWRCKCKNKLYMP